MLICNVNKCIVGCLYNFYMECTDQEPNDSMTSCTIDQLWLALGFKFYVYKTRKDISFKAVSVNELNVRQSAVFFG
jgi:hypothetical protein